MTIVFILSYLAVFMLGALVPVAYFFYTASRDEKRQEQSQAAYREQEIAENEIIKQSQRTNQTRP